MGEDCEFIARKAKDLRAREERGRRGEAREDLGEAEMFGFGLRQGSE